MTAAAAGSGGEARAPGAVAVAADQPAREDGHGHLEQGKLVLISSVQDAPFPPLHQTLVESPEAEVISLD